MSDVSEIYKAYKETLDKTYTEQTKRWEKIREKIKPFYENFLKNLIISPPKENLLLKESAKELFGSDEINFVAIDGSSTKEEFSEFLVFYGGAYAVRGSIKLLENPVRVEYKKWDFRSDKSIVAYMPLPFLDLDMEDAEEMFFYTDREKGEFYSIHNQLMQLAEVYLAYTILENPDSDVKLLLMDTSLSSLYLSNDVLYCLEKGWLRILGNVNGYTIGPYDVLITYAMPINEELQVPSCKDFRGEFYVIFELFDKKCSFFGKRCPFLKEEKHLKRLKQFGVITTDSNLSQVCLTEKVGSTVKERWEYIKQFFKFLCRELFVNKNIDILRVERNGRNLWLSSYDLKFLISIGIRMVMEEAWKKGVLLVGIAKDSSSSYFVRNYLGVMRELGIYKFSPPGIVASDRAILETLPFIDENLQAPWSTIEFDSVFMSLHLSKNEEGETVVEGFRGNVIVPHERLFLRSLAQFYINRSKKKPLTGNVIFVDRLVYPDLDKESRLFLQKEERICTSRGDVVDPIFYENRNSANKVQKILLFLLDTLTKNLFPNVIGYPDPLHKADWGAKSMNRKVKELIRSSELKFISDPLKRTLRQKREEGYRG
jgi:hypothetical protein